MKAQEEVPDTFAGYLAHLWIHVIGLSKVDQIPGDILCGLVDLKIQGKIEHKHVVRYLLFVLDDKPWEFKTAIDILTPICGSRELAIECFENKLKADMVVDLAKKKISKN